MPYPRNRGDRHPLIRLTLLNGRTLIRELGGVSSYPPGSPAVVLYDPRDPADMQVDRTMDLWASLSTARMVGSCLLTAGLALSRQS